MTFVLNNRNCHLKHQIFEAPIRKHKQTITSTDFPPLNIQEILAISIPGAGGEVPREPGGEGLRAGRGGPGAVPGDGGGARCGDAEEMHPQGHPDLQLPGGGWGGWGGWRLGVGPLKHGVMGRVHYCGIVSGDSR